MSISTSAAIRSTSATPAGSFPGISYLNDWVQNHVSLPLVNYVRKQDGVGDVQVLRDDQRRDEQGFHAQRGRCQARSRHGCDTSANLQHGHGVIVAARGGSVKNAPLINTADPGLRSVHGRRAGGVTARSRFDGQPGRDGFWHCWAGVAAFAGVVKPSEGATVSARSPPPTCNWACLMRCLSTGQATPCP